MAKRLANISTLVTSSNGIIHKAVGFFRSASFIENEISNLMVVSDLRENAIKFARSAGVRSDDLADIQIALGEALANAIKHGSPVMGVSRIGVGCHIVDGNFVVVVSDEGKPFDVLKVPNPSLDKCPECGLGIFMMRQVMDDVEFLHNKSGNQVKLTKKLAIPSKSSVLVA